MRQPFFFDPLIARYIRERLADECSRRRGTSSEIARTAGISRAHISNVIDGSRPFGEEFIIAMCKYWGIPLSDLRRIAHDAYNSRALLDSQPKTHPDLDITLAFCRNIFPDDFLNEFELNARREPNRPKLQYFVELHTVFRSWLTRQMPPVQRKYAHLLGMPLASVGNIVVPGIRNSRTGQGSA